MLWIGLWHPGKRGDGNRDWAGKRVQEWQWQEGLKAKELVTEGVRKVQVAHEGREGQVRESGEPASTPLWTSAVCSQNCLLPSLLLSWTGHLWAHGSWWLWLQEIWGLPACGSQEAARSKLGSPSRDDTICVVPSGPWPDSCPRLCNAECRGRPASTQYAGGLLAALESL